MTSSSAVTSSATRVETYAVVSPGYQQAVVSLPANNEVDNALDDAISDDDESLSISLPSENGPDQESAILKKRILKILSTDEDDEESEQKRFQRYRAHSLFLLHTHF